ncbi:MAG: nitrite reductase large subunit NirB [Candidatus Binatia bacterium]
MPTPEETSATLVVVGNGMVAHRLCERLVELDRAARWNVIVFGEEPRPAYDRVHLSSLFDGRTADDLLLGDAVLYAQRNITLHLGDRVLAIDRAAKTVSSARGRCVPYDALVFATGSAPFVPPIPGTTLPGVFVYRTIEDLDAIRAWSARAASAAVIGGGLLGLEAAKAVHDLGLVTHVVEVAPRLMPRQVDASGGEVLRRAIAQLGVHVHLGVQPQALVGDPSVEAIALAGLDPLPVDMVVISAGIRPRDELARDVGIVIGERGGIVVDPELRTSDPAIYAIGECALASGMIYGLVGPGYAMADALAARLTGGDATFTGADLSTKLKLLGIDVASFGDAFADETAGTNAQRLVLEDRRRGVYQKLVLSGDGTHLLGGVLVGDASPYATLLDMCRRGVLVPEQAHELLVGPAAGTAAATADDAAQVCSCNAVTRGAICKAVVDGGLTTVAEIKSCTRAGTGCGGCVPLVATILQAELAKAGRAVKTVLCEHFAYSRQELFEIVKLGRIASFETLLASHGNGAGCEVCRPAVASILASTWNDFVLAHAAIQDTNDRFLANIQRGGTYSVIPRVPGGEITPEKLIVIGEVAKRFDLSCKITGGQRIDLLGARVEDLPAIWEALVDAGFESGHAYGKALRTVKSCVGSTWCRFGVQDSTALAIRIEERYRGLRAPHKLKSAVSGCIRECAEAQSKDFGIIATEQGWNLYVCGNGGSQPRHADLLATDVDADTLIRLIDRFLMYYIHTANPLERTARWLERLDGGLEQLRAIVVDDALGIAAQLESDMERLVQRYACEWAAVVRDPERRRQFALAGAVGPRNGDGFTRVRGQKQPVPWAEAPAVKPAADHDDVDTSDHAWMEVARVADVPRDGGLTIAHGDARIAVFHFAIRDEWWATQATCPHRHEVVLARGLLGTHDGTPKVACPLHKRTFALDSGAGLSDPSLCLRTYPIEVRADAVWVRLPPLPAPDEATPPVAMNQLEEAL